MNNIKKPKTAVLLILYILSFFFFGMFYEYCGAIFTGILSVFLLIVLFYAKSIHMDVNVGTMMSVMLLIGYIVSIVYAVDSGMAFVGLFKYLWVVLFLIAYWQIDDTDRSLYYEVIPYIGGIMCIVGIVGYHISYIYDHLYTNKRLCGFFQYANTFSLFLLVGTIILCDRKEMKLKDYILTLILLVGIGMSGSRIVMVLICPVFIILIIKNKNRRLFACFLGIIIAAVIYIAVTDDLNAVGRITKISFNESTFVGRILYVSDAIPLIVKNPFGIGYMGYYYMENMIQTGLYYVRYLHNDLLQFGLDIGWIPMLAYLYAVVRGITDKTLDFTKKMILAVIFLHGLFDFDLAYTSMLLVVLLIMTEIKSKWLSYSCNISIKAAFIPLVIALLSGIYMSMPLIAYYIGDVDAALTLYPYYTEAKLYKLSQADDNDEVLKLANEIIEQNDTCALPWYAKAMVAYIEDDYENVILCMRKAISKEPFNSEYYEAYEYMLKDGVEYYKNMSDDKKNKELLKKVDDELLSIPEYIDAAKNKISRLGYMIDDQPFN